MAGAAGVRLVEKAWGWSRRRVACAAGSWLGQEACGWSSVAGAEGVWWRVAGAGGVLLEQQACNRLEQDTLAGAGGVWLEQEECG